MLCSKNERFVGVLLFPDGFVAILLQTKVGQLVFGEIVCSSGRDSKNLAARLRISHCKLGARCQNSELQVLKTSCLKETYYVSSCRNSMYISKCANRLAWSNLVSSAGLKVAPQASKT